MPLCLCVATGIMKCGASAMTKRWDDQMDDVFILEKSPAEKNALKLLVLWSGDWGLCSKEEQI